MNFTIFLFYRKNEKTPETLDFTGFSGGVFGVPEVIRTPDLPLRRRSLYPAELLRQVICSAILHLNGKNVNAPGEKCGKTLAFCFLRAYNTKVSAENAPRYRISHEKGAFTIAEQ